MSIIGQIVLNQAHKTLWLRELLNYSMVLTSEKYRIYICNNCRMRKIEKSIYFKKNTIYNKSHDIV